MLAALAIAAPATAATTFTVTTTADTLDANEGDGNCADAAGECSLRAAVMESNSLGGADTIVLPDGTYTLTIGGVGGDDDGDLDIVDDLTVKASANAATVEAGAEFNERIFDLQDAGTNLTLQGFTIRNGTDNFGGGVRFDGADATLTITAMTFNDNQATTGDGGAVFVKTGTLVISGSTFSSNTAGDDGGAVSHGFLNIEHGTRPATVTSSTFTGNAASTNPAESGGNGGDGGAIHAVGPLTVIDSTFQDNTNTTSIGDNGGAIRSEADLTVEGSTFTGNTTRDFGGAIESGAPQPGSDQTDVSVAISDSTFSNNSVIADNANGDGGAIHASVPLSVARSTFTGNSAPDNGGALYVNRVSASVLTSTFADNTATDTGGAIDIDAATLNLQRSTLKSNSAADGAGLNVGPDSTANLVNVTISGNTASDDGGGVHTSGTTNLSFVTIAGNQAADQDADVGAGIHVRLGTTTVRNSILANNRTSPSDTPANCVVAADATLIATGVNVSDDGTCPGIAAGNPALEPLADNGGPTETHALQAGSDAVDAADECTRIDGQEVTLDQRGLQRPADGDDSGTAVCDAGAFELKGTAPQPEVAAAETLTLTPETTSGTVGDELTLTVTVLDDAGQPFEGAQVRFEITGANPTTESATTAADGTASTSYTAHAAGTDTITACTNEDGSLPATCVEATGPTDTATATWQQPARDGEVTRLSGADRWATAIDISQDRFGDDSVSTVVLARGDNGQNDNGFADALAGTPLAVELGVPLLITTPDRLLEQVEAEIERVLVDGGKVILLGGEAALSAEVEARLDALGYVTDRLSGKDRILTALDIARATQASPGAILISRGWAFPDALAAGPAAANADGVVLLNPDTERSSAVEAYLAEHPDVPVFAIGGQIAELFPEATPVFGRDRFETAVEVAQRFFEFPQFIGLARADTFPDSLAGGVHIGLAGGPLVLTLPPHLESEGLHAVTEAYVCDTNGSLTTGYVYGGDAAVSAATAAEFAERIEGQGC